MPIKDKNERIEKTTYFYDMADRKTDPITHDDYIESENDYLEARCLNCNNAKACKEKHWDGCVYEPKYEENSSEIPNNSEIPTGSERSSE